jgi:hypothetical protein
LGKVPYSGLFVYGIWGRRLYFDLAANSISDSICSSPNYSFYHNLFTGKVL